MVAIEELRSCGLMQREYPLCLGGGHGVRAYLPRQLQRFSIDLDFYLSQEDIHGVLREMVGIRGFKVVGYGIESEGRFKRYDSPPPVDLKRCTVALIREYDQSFRSGDVKAEFYVTVSNTLPSTNCEMRKPKSYIEIEYVRGEVPVLSPASIIASKIRVLPQRKIKDFYKDVFDIFALLRLGDSPVDEAEIASALTTVGTRMRRAAVYDKFRESSDASNARNAIKLPSQSREKYLTDWRSINSFVKQKTLTLLERSGTLSD